MTPIADDPTAYPRDRADARWQIDVEKLVFSHTLHEVSGSNARLEGELAEEVAGLKAGEGGDIVVLSSSSIIRGLLEADLLDGLHLLVAPVVLGAGLRFWPEGGPRTDWDLASVEALLSGAVYQTHLRRR